MDGLVLNRNQVCLELMAVCLSQSPESAVYKLVPSCLALRQCFKKKTRRRKNLFANGNNLSLARDRLMSGICWWLGTILVLPHRHSDFIYLLYLSTVATIYSEMKN